MNKCKKIKNQFKKEISWFQYEDMCSTGYNNFPISTVCNAKCIFCSNKMNPFEPINCGFRPLSEVDDFIFRNAHRIDPSTPLLLSDAIPGRIVEGEAVLHPDFLEICWKFRNAFPNMKLHISTNGSKLTKGFIKELEKLKPFEMMFSYHSTDPEMWQEIFGLSRKDYDTATAAWPLLVNAGIKVAGAIVAMPNMQGLEDIEKTIKWFDKHHTFAVQYWEGGYNKFATDDLREKIHMTEHEAHTELIYRMYKECKTSICWFGDKHKPIDFYPYAQMKQAQLLGIPKILWLTGERSYERVKAKVEQDGRFFGLDQYVQKVKNYSYGGSISCNGLLMVSDLRRAVDEAPFEPELIITPNNMLDRFGRDLMGESYTQLSHIPTWWRSE